jgi:hypothetical protein
MITPGFGRCGDCGDPVLYALASSGDVIAFDAAFQDGPWVIAWDCTRTPRCRPVGASVAVRASEYRYERHAVACPARASVTDLAAERLMRRRPVPAQRAHRRERRTAHAR